jgi:Zn ribbon nucleic-acid-binding protein
MENIVEEKQAVCPVCNNSHRLFVENEPDGGKSQMCLNCGYVTTTKYQIGSEFIADVESKQPKLITAIKFEDKETNQIWYPQVIQVSAGMIFPDGTDIDNWKWAVAKTVIIPVFERINYPIDNKPGEYYESKLDIENVKHFDKMQIVDAFKEIGLIIPE